MNEFDRAVVLANLVLDRPNADPDDDLAVLARQFTRMIERDAQLLMWWQMGSTLTLELRNRWLKRYMAVIDPTGAVEGRYG